MKVILELILLSDSKDSATVKASKLAAHVRVRHSSMKVLHAYAHDCFNTIQEHFPRLRAGCFDVYIERSPSGRHCMYCIGHLPFDSPSSIRMKWLPLQIIKDPNADVSLRLFLYEVQLLNGVASGGIQHGSRAPHASEASGYPDAPLSVTANRRKQRCSTIGDWRRKIEAVKRMQAMQGGKINELCKMVDWSQPRISEATRYLSMGDEFVQDMGIDQSKRAELESLLQNDQTSIKSFKCWKHTACCVTKSLFT